MTASPQLRSIEELRRRTCDLRGLGEIRLVVVENGPGRGQRLLICRNAVGIEFEVAVDRAFDISALRYRAVNLGWNSPVGLPAPGFPADLESGLGLLRSLDGFLATCGLDHYGEPTEGPADHFIYPARRTVHYPLHGRISHEPATILGYGLTESSPATIWCEAEVRQAAVFGEVLVLRRRIELELFRTRISLSDVVVNRGFRPARHAMLYHFNLGFPFLDENVELIGGFGPLMETFRASPPVPGDDRQERDDLIDPQSDSRGLVTVGMRNPTLLNGVSLHLSFPKAQLPQVNLWRCWQSGLYVMGVEPCTALNRTALSYEGKQTPHFLDPGAAKHYDLTLDVTEDVS